jgi:small conductance mechanosensitive channel
MLRTLVFFLLLMLSLPAAAQEESAAIKLQKEQSAAEAPPPAPEPVIPLASDDPEIAKRLTALYAEITGLEAVRSTVKSGVVTLTGTTLTSEDRQRAENIAGRLAGVVSVENKVTVETDVGKRLQPLFARAKEIAGQIVAFLPLLAIALVVFAFFWIAGVLFTRSRALFGRIAPNPLVRTLFGQIIRLAFVLVGLVLAMRIMGATTLLSSVLGAAGVIGLAIGFAIRDTIENYIASILLSIRRPFAPNDLVIIDGVEGRVTRLNSRATFLTSLQGNEIRIPNAIVYKSKIENFTSIPERRFEFKVGIGYENDLCTAVAVAREAALATPGVLDKPEPVVLVETLGDSTIVMEVRAWMNQLQSDFCKVRGATMRSIKEAFDDQAISMPEPIQNVRIFEGQVEKHNVPPEATSKPDRKEVAEATDTAPDRTIEGKVEELRAGPEEDLLTTKAPRE